MRKHDINPAKHVISVKMLCIHQNSWIYKTRLGCGVLWRTLMLIPTRDKLLVLLNSVHSLNSSGSFLVWWWYDCDTPFIVDAATVLTYKVCDLLYSLALHRLNGDLIRYTRLWPWHLWTFIWFENVAKRFITSTSSSCLPTIQWRSGIHFVRDWLGQRPWTSLRRSWTVT